MNTNEVRRQLNISSKALRIYESMGIVVPERTENNYRNYSKDDLMKLRQVTLLKEMGIPLKNIKELLDQEISKDNKIIRGLNLQFKAVENKISELQKIKETLKQSINEALEVKIDENYDNYFDRIMECLNENRANRTEWIDKWGFDEWAKNYDNSLENNDSWDELRLFEKYDYVLKCIAQIIINSNAKNVLDIGCGTANIVKRLPKGIKYTGMDQSIEMLLKAKNKFSDINLRLGNFLDEPFDENEFDAVITSYAFHHLNQLEKENAINLLLRYLKQGGKLIIADLMFLNEAEREKQKQKYVDGGRMDLWDIVEDEYYSDVEKIKEYAEFLGGSIKTQHLVNFTWLVEICK
ncbi:MerR family transcriptional regulator [Inconstantimicrobium mannanitabidum]|uniref:MerR family transcriptional regulator n=1 Tax=Inconstantimicrobium mannanitabidum TaxID=1604901 RepID=A0ACB5R8J1_9CLOT|nr:MerR family transcriptional regulator [Clostridium sp. TW13]GKX65357.1 MerR family transcriptional regulator [Clostridium sp. TW13]